jgi:hypothetical protein
MSIAPPSARMRLIIKDARYHRDTNPIPVEEVLVPNPEVTRDVLKAIEVKIVEPESLLVPSIVESEPLVEEPEVIKVEEPEVIKVEEPGVIKVEEPEVIKVEEPVQNRESSPVQPPKKNRKSKRTKLC